MRWDKLRKSSIHHLNLYPHIYTMPMKQNAKTYFGCLCILKSHLFNFGMFLICSTSVYFFSKTCTTKGERGIGSDTQLCGGQKVIKIGPHLCILSHTCLIKHMKPFVMRGQLTESWETSALKSRVLKCLVAVPGVSFTVLGQSP